MSLLQEQRRIANLEAELSAANMKVTLALLLGLVLLCIKVRAVREIFRDMFR